MKLGFRLLCITDRRATQGEKLDEVVSELVVAGLRGLQLREKDLPDAAFRVLAGKIRQVTEKMPVRVFIHSRIEIARDLGAGLHLAEGSDVSSARKAMGPEALIGVSCHSLESAKAAESAGASFVLYGPVFPPISKSVQDTPVGLDLLSQLAQQIFIPVVAVGGITPENARSCLKSGAQAVASIGSLLGAPDPRSRLLDFMRAMGRL